MSAPSSEANEHASPSCNVVVLRGICSSDAETRVLPSEESLVQLQVTTRAGGETRSVPVAVWDPPAWVHELCLGDEVVVVGSVRRRFFRAGGATASRVEVEAKVVAPARDRRRVNAALRRVDEMLGAAT